MDATHLHLMLNHLPVLGTPFALGLLIYGLWRRSEELKRTAFGVVCIVSLLSIPVYLTGESAAEAISNIPDVSKALIEQHDQAAAVSFTAILIAGIGAGIALFRSRRAKVIPRWLTRTLLLTLIIISALMAWTAHIGGQIRHTEIRSAVPAKK